MSNQQAAQPDAAVPRARVRLLADNTRFRILPWVRVPHLLGAVARRIAADWATLYGHPVHDLETFVDAERVERTCCRAANWRVLGLPLHADFRRCLGVGA